MLVLHFNCAVVSLVFMASVHCYYCTVVLLWFYFVLLFVVYNTVCCKHSSATHFGEWQVEMVKLVINLVIK